MYEDRTAARRRKIIVLFIIAIVGLVLYFSLLKVSRQGEIAVRINVLPENAKITINDGDPFKGSMTAYLAPGTYKLTLSAEGFKTTGDMITVGDQSVTEYYVLPSNSFEAEEWKKDNQQKILEFEGKTAEQAAIDAQRFQQRNKVTSVLPYRNVLYSIEYKADEQQNVTVIINADSPENRAFAVNKLRDLGFEPTDQRLEFNSPFINPFQEREDEESEYRH